MNEKQERIYNKMIIDVVSCFICFTSFACCLYQIELDDVNIIFIIVGLLSFIVMMYFIHKIDQDAEDFEKYFP